MKISIDTQIMNDIAEISSQISTLITDAHALLAPVTEHDDWNCKERDIINERLMAVKKAGTALDETSVMLAAAFRDISERFMQMEKSIPFDLSGTVSEIGNVLSEPYSSYTSNAGSASYAAAAQTGINVTTDDMMSAYEANELFNPLKIMKVRDEK